MIYTLKNSTLAVEIDSLGAQLTSVKNNGEYEFIWNGAEWRGHAPLLFPVCGRLLDGKFTSRGRQYEMKSHGFAKLTEFVASDISDTSITFTLTANDETRAIYPFDFSLTAKYTLEDNRLDAVFTVSNEGKHVMPYMFGWHPGFTLGGNKEIGSFYVDFGSKKSLVRYSLQNGAFINPFYSTYPLKAGKYYLNEEEIYANDTMIFRDTNGTVRLAGGAQKHSITLSFSDNLPYFCIWKAPSNTARFICLEPWSDLPADGETPENFDSRQMSRLSAGKSESYRYSVIFE